MLFEELLTIKKILSSLNMHIINKVGCFWKRRIWTLVKC